MRGGGKKGRGGGRKKRWLFTSSPPFSHILPALTKKVGKSEWKSLIHLKTCPRFGSTGGGGDPTGGGGDPTGGGDPQIDWQGNWAFACDFVDNDMGSAQTSGDDCGPTCVATSGCTHFVWSNYLVCYLTINRAFSRFRTASR